MLRIKHLPQELTWEQRNSIYEYNPVNRLPKGYLEAQILKRIKALKEHLRRIKE